MEPAPVQATAAQPELHEPEHILASMRPDGSHVVIHPADVKGRWITRRRVLFGVLVALYVGLPLIQIGEHPSIYLDVDRRRFFLFGGTFNSQDVWLVLLIGLSVAFGLLFMTAWRGRVWCGWACPQTVFLEGVYRPIERFFDGPRERRLKKQPWGPKRIARFAAKQLAFLIVSVAIAHAATAIFTSPAELRLMIIEGPSRHLEAFLLSSGFAVILMFNFAWFREQFCVVLCPYGRLQSVLHDRDSIVVAYDEKRGEPRGRLLKGAAPGVQGDCVDCFRCVTACPTGVDIRNGLQMECVSCQQCIDACDDVMQKVKRPRGLITFKSQNELDGLPRRVWRPRLIVYGALTLLSVFTLGVSLVTRTPFESNIIRPRGANPFMLDGAVVRNAFEVHLINKNPVPSKFHLALTADVPITAAIGTPDVELESLHDARVPVLVTVDVASLGKPLELTLEIKDDQSGVVKRQPVRFLAPLGLKR